MRHCALRSSSVRRRRRFLLFSSPPSTYAVVTCLAHLFAGTPSRGPRPERFLPLLLRPSWRVVARSHPWSAEMGSMRRSEPGAAGLERWWQGRASIAGREPLSAAAVERFESDGLVADGECTTLSARSVDWAFWCCNFLVGFGTGQSVTSPSCLLASSCCQGQRLTHRQPLSTPTTHPPASVLQAPSCSVPSWLPCEKDKFPGWVGVGSDSKLSGE